MQTLTVDLGDRSYPIHIGHGLIGRADLILPHLAQKRVAIVTNTTVGPLYLERLTQTLTGAGVSGDEPRRGSRGQNPGGHGRLSDALHPLVG